MLITRKRFNEAIKEAQEKAFCEANNARWQSEEIENIRRTIQDLNSRLEALESKGKRKFRCPCAVFPKNY